MTPLWWSVLLAVIGIVGLALAGRARAEYGWTVGLAAQVLWIVYGMATGQYGFLLSSLGYGLVYGINLRRALARRRSERVAAGLMVGIRAQSVANAATAIGPGAIAVAGDHAHAPNPR